MLEYIRTTLDGLTDVEKEHYKKEGDSKFVLDVKDDKEDRVQGLIKNKNEALAEKSVLQKRVKELESSTGGAELEKAKSKITELETQLTTVGKSGKYSEDQVSQIKRDLEQKYGEQIKNKDKELNEVHDKISTSQRDTAIRDALTSAGVRTGAVTMMTAFLKDRVVMEKGETGLPVIRIKKEDGSGNEVSTKDGGVFKSIPELVDEIKSNKDYGFAFEGSKASGGGAKDIQTDQGGSGDGKTILARSDLKTMQEKSTYLAALKEKHGGDDVKAQEEYFTLPENRPDSTN